MNDSTNNSNSNNIAVIYTDGSAINPGPYGAGAHGYIYNTNNSGTKTGDRPPKYIITETGYLEQEKSATVAHTTVTPSYYINAIYSYLPIGTNNIAELLAVTETLSNLLDNTIVKINEIYIKTDSMYVIHIFNKITSSDQKNWLNTVEINLDFWKIFSEVLNKLQLNKIKITINKVLGHSTSLGNHLADRLALLARIESTRLVAQNSFNIEPAVKYWSKNETQHTFLKFKQLFFTNNLRSSSPEIMYSILDYKTDVEPGKKTHEATFGLVILKEPPTILEEAIIAYQSYLKQLSVVATVDMAGLYSQFNSKYFSIFGSKAYIFNSRHNVLEMLQDLPVVMTVQPAGLATQAFDKMEILYTIIKEYRILKSDGIPVRRMYIDITDKIYTVTDKKTTTILSLTDVKLDITVEYGYTQILIPLEIGKDCLDRNKFKQIEKMDTRVTLVLEKVSEKSFHYYTIVDMVKTGDIAIFCNFYNNKIFLSK